MPKYVHMGRQCAACGPMFQGVRWSEKNAKCDPNGSVYCASSRRGKCAGIAFAQMRGHNMAHSASYLLVSMAGGRAWSWQHIHNSQAATGQGKTALS